MVLVGVGNEVVLRRNITGNRVLGPATSLLLMRVYCLSKFVGAEVSVGIKNRFEFSIE